MIFIISLFVFNFINTYIYKEKNFKLFYIITVLFIFAILILIFSINLWTIIIGWEILGISSFYLIFFYNNNESWIRSIKTFLNNKIGDIFLLITIIILSINLINFNIIFFFNNLIVIIFFIALITKRAQYPFITWLPLAIAAPTPISSLVHSSTLVTAGLYILLRYNFLFKNLFYVNLFSNLCLFSILISRMKAINEKDIKKIIALSTLSQIRIIFFFLIINIKFLTFIYLCNHALFKSLIFVNIGILIIFNYRNQFNISINTFRRIKLYLISFKISCLNLINLSFFSSYFIKENLIFNLYTINLNLLKFYLFLFNCYLTINYSLKFLNFFIKLNFKIKLNIILKYKDYLLLCISIFSLIFRKYIINLYYFNLNRNIIIIIFYCIILLINLKVFNNSIKIWNELIYLNFIIFKFPQKFLFKINNLKNIDIWIEYLLIYSINIVNKKFIYYKTYFMNLKLSLYFFYFIWLILFIYY